MKQKNAEQMAMAFFTLTVIETVLSKEGEKRLELMIRTCESIIYNTVSDEGETDTFKVKVDEIYKNFISNVENQRIDPKLVTSMKAAYARRRLRKMILKSEEAT